MKKHIYSLLAVLFITAFTAPAFAISAGKHSAKGNTVTLRKEAPVKQFSPVVKSETAVRAEATATVQETQETKAQLTRKEMRHQNKALRKELKNKLKSAPKDDMQVICIILCFFLPPLAVYLYEGSITTNFWIDLILTLLFWLPGVIFALLVCLDVI